MVVVIDVLRAFSTAAYAYAAGVEDIYLVSTVEDAFRLKKEINNSRIMGEVDGMPVEGFDYGNSPSQFDGLNLSGIPLIQRTTSGTQGVVKSVQADEIITASFCNAGATVRYIESMGPTEVSFIITGKRPGGWGDEDQACAEYIESLLLGQEVYPEPYLRRVKQSIPGRYFLDPKMPGYPEKDLIYSLNLNKFNFAMTVNRVDGHLRMHSSTL